MFLVYESPRSTPFPADGVYEDTADLIQILESIPPASSVCFLENATNTLWNLSRVVIVSVLFCWSSFPLKITFIILINYCQCVNTGSCFLNAEEGAPLILLFNTVSICFPLHLTTTTSF